MDLKTLDQHIKITSDIAGGKPHISGHRITVQDIVIWHERMGKSADEIASDYSLSLSDVYAALTYYFDHRVEMDQAMLESEAYVKVLKQTTKSKLLQNFQTQNGQ